MQLDPETCHRALASRDARFDGRFVVAVVTTGIYCRPSCPARPLRANVRFLACAAAAEAAGFRPCRRCRPEAAPGSPIWSGTASTVSRALRLIDDGALDRGDAAALAAQLGIGDRALRRLFDRHLGTSPLAVAISRRAHFARALLDSTDLPMTEVALAAGFRSVRQFNHVVRAVFERTPGELRGRRGPDRRGPGAVRLRLALRPPIAWRALLEFLAARAIPGVEEVDADRIRYRRTFSDGAGVSSILSVQLAADGRALEVEIGGADGLPGARTGALFDVARRVRRLFDLDADPRAVAAHLGDDRRLAPSLVASPGLRVPGAWDPFEVLVRALLGQQISVAAATTLAGRLVARCGAPIEAADPLGDLRRVFPTAAAVAADDVAAIGLPSARAEALRRCAAAVAADPALLAASAGLDPLVDRLRSLPGVGPWTAHYVAMRLGEPDAFPAGDLGLRRAVGDPTERELAAVAEAWRPWRAYAAIALWQRLAAQARVARVPRAAGESGRPRTPTRGESCPPSARASIRR